jgi:Ulp1 family protease
MGWTWDDLQDVPQPVYDELIAYLVDEQARTDARRR